MSNCVWYISKYFGLPESRVGSRAFLLLRELSAMGVHPLVITASGNHLFTSREFDGPALHEQIEGVDICWLNLRKYQGAKSIGRILSWLEFELKLWRLPKDGFPTPVAIVVSTLSLFTILNGLRLKARYRCRLIFEVRDIWPLTIVEEGGFSPLNPFVMLLQWVERLGYRKSDAIVGTMPNLELHVREVAGTTGPVHCVPMGIHSDQLGEPAPLSADYVSAHIPQGKFVVCHAGTIGKTNALEVLFDVARAMQARRDIHFLLVGDGDLKARYQGETADLANVSFAPAVAKTQVQSLLRHCDVTFFSVYPSRVWDYGMSLNKVVDYMLAGRPVIGSYSGFHSMLNESGGGTFVPAGDAAALQAEILRLASMDPAERHRMGAAARDWIIATRQFPDLARRYLEIMTPGCRDVPVSEAVQP